MAATAAIKSTPEPRPMAKATPAGRHAAWAAGRPRWRSTQALAPGRGRGPIEARQTRTVHREPTTGRPAPYRTSGVAREDGAPPGAVSAIRRGRLRRPPPQRR
jgi:hypothetical protein